MSPAAFQRWAKEIASFYDQTSNDLGYRFLYCPRGNLWEHNGTLLLGLNPGGTREARDLESEGGLSYRVESWGAGKEPGSSALQKQVMRLLAALSPDPDRTLCSNLVFFRSPNWSCLLEKKETVRFCADLWEEILNTVPPFAMRIFIGKRTYDLAKQNIASVRATRITDELPLWANGRVLIDRTPGCPITIVLPHLSRWRFVKEGNQTFEKLIEIVGSR